MNLTRALPPLVLAAFLAALSVTALGDGDVDGPRHPAWPPHPARIVNLSSQAANAPASLQPGQLWSAFFVPPGSTLVVTHASFAGEDTVLGEFLGTELTFKRRGSATSEPLAGTGLDPGAPLGWTFRPGSQVAFRNDAGGAAPLAYQLVGYLAGD